MNGFVFEDKKCQIKNCQLLKWDGCIWEKKCVFHCRCKENKYGIGKSYKEQEIANRRKAKIN